MISLNKMTYAEAVSWYEGVFFFVVHPSENFNHEIQMWIGLNNGKCTGAKVFKRKLRDEEITKMKERGEIK